MLKRIFTGLYRFIWYTFAFIVLNAAVVVTAVRIALPEIGAYKNEIQAWVSEYMEYPVTIESINAEWKGWTPHLYLKNIDLYTQDDGQLITKFDSAHVGINLVNSLIAREITPNYLSISGLNLEFTRNNDGSISVSSDSTNRLSTGNSSDDKALSEWLFKQEHIIVNDATLAWHDEKSSADTVIFSNVLIDLKTDKDRIQLNASVDLPDELGDKLNINMDAYGNLLTTNWSGDIYIEALNVTNPTALITNTPIQMKHGYGNMQLWTHWSNAKLNNFNASLDYEQVLIFNEQHSLPVNSLIANIRGQRQQTRDWQIDVQLEEMETNNGNWPKTEYKFNTIKSISNHQSQTHIILPYLKLDHILPFLPNNQFPSDGFLKNIDLKSTRGELLNLSIALDDDPQSKNKFQLSTQFQDLNINNSDQDLMASGLDGQLLIENDLINIQLDSNGSSLKANNLFEETISFSNIQSSIEFLQGGKPEIRIDNIKLVTDDVSLSGSGLIQTDSPSPFIDFVMHLDRTPIDTVQKFLPKNTNEKLSNWLKQALVAGNILSGDLIVRGYTKDFPFRDAEGQFKAILSVGNATLDYKEGWPLIYNINADVIFENDSLTIQSDYGQIFDAEIESVTAHVNNLSQKGLHVLVDGSLSGHTSDAINTILQSPLSENDSLKELADMHIAGNLELDLKLDIPLGDGPEITQVDGLLSFDNVSLESDLSGLGLEEVNGDILFTRDHFWSEKLDALYHSQPVVLSIPKFEREDDDLGTFIISGQADKEFIVTELNGFFPALLQTSNDIKSYMNGQSEWSLSINKRRDESGVSIKDIEINSDLKGITIDLPDPLGKLDNEIRNLNIKTQLKNNTINKFDIDYDNNIYTEIIVDNSPDLTLKKILIGLGKDHNPDDTANDISIQGELEQLEVTKWLDFLNLRKVNMPVENKLHKTISSEIFVNNLNLIDNNFKDVNIDISNTNKYWLVNFNSNDIKGNAELIEQSINNKNRLIVNLDHLLINSEKDKNSGNEDNKKINVADLPELDINIKNLIFNERGFGQTSLVTTNFENGINIDQLNIQKPDLNINARGKWTQIDNIDRSEFKITLDSDSVDSMLETFGYDSANIKDGASSFELRANWMDSPLNFSMAKADGELDMKIGKGQFLDINPSAGRLFGLLSIQTLPRRLSLDFSDLFDEGFSFDSIEGNFSLQQGHAYTNNLEMVGPAANVVVSGRTGIISEDYDQIATVTPKVSNTLPVASALFGPVGVGVGAVIYLAGELFESIPKNINKILSYQYSITGSWDNPDIEKIKEEKGSG